MNVVIIIGLILSVGLVVFALFKLGALENRIDDIFHKALTMQGEIEENTARAKDNYKFIAQVNEQVSELHNAVMRKHEHSDEPTKEVEEELESLILEREQEEEVEPSNAAYELSVRRENFAHFRKQGMDIKNAGIAVGVSYSTAKRYEQWRKDNKK